jgi:hypothetical protein
MTMDEFEDEEEDIDDSMQDSLSSSSSSSLQLNTSLPQSKHARVSAAEDTVWQCIDMVLCVISFLDLDTRFALRFLSKAVHQCIISEQSPFSYSFRRPVKLTVKGAAHLLRRCTGVAVHECIGGNGDTQEWMGRLWSELNSTYVEHLYIGPNIAIVGGCESLLRLASRSPLLKSLTILVDDLPKNTTDCISACKSLTSLTATVHTFGKIDLVQCADRMAALEQIHLVCAGWHGAMNTAMDAIIHLPDMLTEFTITGGFALPAHIDNLKAVLEKHRNTLRVVRIEFPESMSYDFSMWLLRWLDRCHSIVSFHAHTLYCENVLVSATDVVRRHPSLVDFGICAFTDLSPVKSKKSSPPKLLTKPYNGPEASLMNGPGNVIGALSSLVSQCCLSPRIALVTVGNLSWNAQDMRIGFTPSELTVPSATSFVTLDHCIRMMSVIWKDCHTVHTLHAGCVLPDECASTLSILLSVLPNVRFLTTADGWLYEPKCNTLVRAILTHKTLATLFVDGNPHGCDLDSLRRGIVQLHPSQTESMNTFTVRALAAVQTTAAKKAKSTCVIHTRLPCESEVYSFVAHLRYFLNHVNTPIAVRVTGTVVCSPRFLAIADLIIASSSNKVVVWIDDDNNKPLVLPSPAAKMGPDPLCVMSVRSSMDQLEELIQLQSDVRRLGPAAVVCLTYDYMAHCDDEEEKNAMSTSSAPPEFFRGWMQTVTPRGASVILRDEYDQVFTPSHGRDVLFLMMEAVHSIVKYNTDCVSFGNHLTFMYTPHPFPSCRRVCMQLHGRFALQMQMSESMKAAELDKLYNACHSISVVVRSVEEFTECQWAIRPTKATTLTVDVSGAETGEDAVRLRANIVSRLNISKVQMEDVIVPSKNTTVFAWKAGK